MYDVIVIGAGPAGSTASKVLAESGYKVLMVEKFKMPRYKSCSGQLIKKSIDLVMAYYGEDVPEHVMCLPHENRGMIFTSDKGKEYRFEQPGLNVWRSSFDKWLSDKAKEAGAEVRDGTIATSCEENEDAISVVLKSEESYTVQAKYVIDCEGVVGSLKKQLIEAKPSFINTYQTYNNGTINLDHHYFYAYLQPELSEYDAWFNVKDNSDGHVYYDQINKTGSVWTTEDDYNLFNERSYNFYVSNFSSSLNSNSISITPSTSFAAPGENSYNAYINDDIVGYYVRSSGSSQNSYNIQTYRQKLKE